MLYTYNYEWGHRYVWLCDGSWWRHQMETFSALLAICAGNSPVPGEFPAQRPVTRSFDIFYDLRPNNRLSKQWWGWWFETPTCPLWRHRNVVACHLEMSFPKCPMMLRWHFTMPFSSSLNWFKYLINLKSIWKYLGCVRLGGYCTSATIAEQPLTPTYMSLRLMFSLTFYSEKDEKFDNETTLS